MYMPKNINETLIAIKIEFLLYLKLEGLIKLNIVFRSDSDLQLNHQWQLDYTARER